MKFIFILLSGIILSIPVAKAQQLKIESEKEVKAEELPTVISNILSNIITHAKRVKYYEEKDSSSTFYEVKMKYSEKLLSIKFYENGELFDIEETINFKEIEIIVQDSIKNYFNSNFANYHIKKVQLNYTASHNSIDALQKYFSNQLGELILKYEIEAFIKSDSDAKTALNEFLFSSQAKLLLRQKINSRATDYVSY